MDLSLCVLERMWLVVCSFCYVLCVVLAGVDNCEYSPTFVGTPLCLSDYFVGYSMGVVVMLSVLFCCRGSWELAVWLL